MSRTGRFITFEGIEGSGKSLQMNLLADSLREREMPCILTLEPGGTAFGLEVREILLRTSGAPREPVAELLLYLADRYQHLKEVIEPALQEGLIVLSDRYHDATLAYQGYARRLGIQWADRLAAFLGIPRPDLTFLLDIPVETGLTRARARNQQSSPGHSRFENEDLEFHRKVREGYLRIAANETQRFEIIDGEGTPHEVFHRIMQALLERNLI